MLNNTMSPAQLHILQHSLGLDKHGQGTSYRNRFVTDPTCPDGILCTRLVALGLMRDYGPQSLAGGMHCYAVSPAGIDAVNFESPPPPKLTRSQRRYHAWLKADCGLTFFEWLTSESVKQLDTHS